MAVLAVAFYLDYNREWKPYELAYYNHFKTPGATEEVKQLTSDADEHHLLSGRQSQLARASGPGLHEHHFE